MVRPPKPRAAEPRRSPGRLCPHTSWGEGADVTGELVADLQAQQESLLAQVDRVVRSTDQDRRAEFHRLRLQLALHECVMRRAVDPQIHRQRGAHDHVVEDRAEAAAQIIAAVRMLERLDLQSAPFEQGLLALADALQAHAQARAEYEWPALRELTDPLVIQPVRDALTAIPALLDSPDGPGPAATLRTMTEWADARIRARPGL